MIERPRFGKITRRLFAVFLVFALVPTTVLTVLALRYVSDKAVEQVDELQDEQAGMLADTLLGRLVVLTEQLNHFAREEARTIAPGAESSREIGGNQFSVFPPVVLEGAAGMRARDEASKRLDQGELVLARFGWDGSPRRVYLLRAVWPGEANSP